MNVKIAIERADTAIPDTAMVKVIQAGNTYTVKWVARQKIPPEMKKVAQGWYLNPSTGEIIQARTNEGKQSDPVYLRKTMEALRGKINANFTGAPNELFITLTYRENMQDVEKLYKDFKAFMQRLSRWAGERPQYINVVEPQERGAWHCHVLCRWPNKRSILLPNAECKRLWGYGHTVVKRLKGVDNIGAYLSSYLTNLNGKKGGRLRLYKSGQKIWRCSQGLKEPISIACTYAEAKKMLHRARCSGKRGISIKNTETDELYNTIVTQWYTAIKEEKMTTITFDGKLKITTDKPEKTDYLIELVEGLHDQLIPYLVGDEGINHNI